MMITKKFLKRNSKFNNFFSDVGPALLNTPDVTNCTRQKGVKF